MLFTDKCQNFATDRILEAAFYIDTERGNYMKTIVVCDDVEIERLLLKEILCQYFEEINEEVSIVEYDSGDAYSRCGRRIHCYGSAFSGYLYEET